MMIYINDRFKKKISKRDFDIEEIGIDNFYAASFNLILSDLKNENYSSETNKNFYSNICKPLLNKNNDLSKATELIYDPRKYEDIKFKYKLNSDNIIPILYGYRYVLNELTSDNENNIYHFIYNRSNFDNIKKNFILVIILNIIKDILILWNILNLNRMKAVRFVYVKIGFIILLLLDSQDMKR